MYTLEANVGFIEFRNLIRTHGNSSAFTPMTWLMGAETRKRGNATRTQPLYNETNQTSNFTAVWSSQVTLGNVLCNPSQLVFSNRRLRPPAICLASNMKSAMLNTCGLDLEPALESVFDMASRLVPMFQDFGQLRDMIWLQYPSVGCFSLLVCLGNTTP